MSRLKDASDSPFGIFLIIVAIISFLAFAGCLNSYIGGSNNPPLALLLGTGAMFGLAVLGIILMDNRFEDIFHGKRYNCG
jgi:hypothetical protein